MTLTQLTNDLINYYEDYDEYDFRDVENPDMFDDIYKDLLNENRRQIIINCLKECIEESNILSEVNGAVRLINEIKKLGK